MAATTYPADLLAPTEAPTAALAKSIDTTNPRDSVFKLLYFPYHGRAEFIRLLLVYAGVQFEEVPVEWPAMKPLTPFGYLPVLYETTSDSTVLELAESKAIERYLAKRFGLTGSNSWEEQLVEQFSRSIEGITLSFIQILLMKSDEPEKRAEAAKRLYEQELPKWIEVESRHLKKNGSNGHHVGKSLTVADLELVVLMDRVMHMIPAGVDEKSVREKVFSKELTPELWRVKEVVDGPETAEGRIGQWKKSERFKLLTESTRTHFKFH